MTLLQQAEIELLDAASHWAGAGKLAKSKQEALEQIRHAKNRLKLAALAFAIAFQKAPWL